MDDFQYAIDLLLGYEYYNQRNELVRSFKYLNLPEPGPLIIPKRSFRRPAKGDLVNYNDKLGTIAWVSADDVNVYFGDNLEALDLDYFSNNYNSPRGKTVWKL